MVLVRIIPARAGFTCRGTPKTVLGRDHPRSRGVYPVADPLATVTAGSSPLARGLHPPDAGHAPARRIIPARAGFTRSSSLPGSPPADHPRSRGVYVARRRERMECSGSSPLARGLLEYAADRLERSRIIPARAGFTGRGEGLRRVAADHPRSRGVYSPRSIRCPIGPGSSPLARGLRSGPREGPQVRRIIPARAGFTPGRCFPCGPALDHPRSRGVYACPSPPWMT